MTADIKEWCCLGRGKSLIRVWFEKDVYMPGETAKIIGEFDNTNCTKPIENIMCDLVNRVTFKSDSGKTFFREKAVTRVTIPGVGAGQSALASNNTSKYQELPLISNTGVPLLPTASGTIVSSRHFMKVTSTIDGCCMCCGDVPSVEIPVSIV